MLQRIAIPASLVGLTQLKLNSPIAKCSDDHVHAPTYDFPHNGMFSSYDAMSIRRGFQVYRQVCASCHSISQISFRQLVGVSHTEEQMKAIAASYDVIDKVPDDSGEPLERPGKLADKIPSPYQNEEQARMANAGALPPDLSCMVKARHTGSNYVFAIMTGYMDAPVGKQVPDGLHYNAYFPGTAIAMAKPLSDGAVEYEDGTPATEAQMAKDVACFLAWTSEPEHDERKRKGMVLLCGLMIAALITGYHKRFRWSTLKTARLDHIMKK